MTLPAPGSSWSGQWCRFTVVRYWTRDDGASLVELYQVTGHRDSDGDRIWCASAGESMEVGWFADWLADQIEAGAVAPVAWPMTWGAVGVSDAASA